jgi:hypothetical protein
MVDKYYYDQRQGKVANSAINNKSSIRLRKYLIFNQISMRIKLKVLCILLSHIFYLTIFMLYRRNAQNPHILYQSFYLCKNSVTLYPYETLLYYEYILTQSTFAKVYFCKMAVEVDNFHLTISSLK